MKAHLQSSTWTELYDELGAAKRQLEAALSENRRLQSELSKLQSSARLQLKAILLVVDSALELNEREIEL
jgi:regulator of replication initiation timing